MVNSRIGTPNFHSILFQFGEVAKLRITFFKGLRHEGAVCKLGWARKMRLRKVRWRKMTTSVGGGEVKATVLPPVDGKQVWTALLLAAGAVSLCPGTI